MPFASKRFLVFSLLDPKLSLMNHYYIAVRTSNPVSNLDHYYYVKASGEQLATILATTYANMSTGGSTPAVIEIKPIDEAKYETGGIPKEIKGFEIGTLRIAPEPEE
jgi:hypothetical protein